MLAFRLARQGILARPQASQSTLVDVVGRMVGFHAQVMSSAELQAAARIDGLRVADVRDALERASARHTAVLVAAGAVRKNQPVKVLGDGEISVAVTVTADKVSASAKSKIEAAGGSVTEAGA